MSEDQAKLNELLDTALELPADQREGWLEALPDEHSSLKPRLRALLARAARIETSDFLKTLPKISVEEVSGAGDVIGPYRLLRQIGSGGMGSVWLAERHDGALKRQVALKFLRAAAPNDSIAERLQRERDIVAALEHPAHRAALRRRSQQRRLAVSRARIHRRRAHRSVLPRLATSTFARAWRSCCRWRIQWRMRTASWSCIAT